MTKLCPACQSPNNDTARFCTNCAAPLVTELVCSACGTINAPTAKFCSNCAAPLRGITPPLGLTGLLSPNTTLANRYQVQKKLGRGGMGAVYLVTDLRLAHKPWAVKEMSDAALTDPQEKALAIEAFQREAALLAALNHPNLARVVDYFEDHGKHYLVMDFIEGNTLSDLLDGRREPFPTDQVLTWAEQLCDVLGYLHTHTPPIIFRDLKPGNIMLDQHDHIHLIDFGVARLFKPGASRDTVSLGTPGYAPPEQYGRGQSDPRSDVYALGATLHQLLTLRDPGDEPFRFPPASSLNPSLPSHITTAIQKALSQDREARWSSMAAFNKALFTPDGTPLPAGSYQSAGIGGQASRSAEMSTPARWDEPAAVNPAPSFPAFSPGYPQPEPAPKIPRQPVRTPQVSPLGSPAAPAEGEWQTEAVPELAQPAEMAKTRSVWGTCLYLGLIAMVCSGIIQILVQRYKLDSSLYFPLFTFFPLLAMGLTHRRGAAALGLFFTIGGLISASILLSMIGY
jgi:serine/threonine protein kinase